uniref:Uncharacterized protein n=1 Tax=Cannabis sativa TaxID=3483 RepID=A0A803Q774_CANSA
MADKKNNLQSLQNEVEVIKIPEHEVENNGDRAHVQEPNDEDAEETNDEEGHSRWLNDAKDMQSTTLGIERRCPHPEVIENSRYSTVTSQTCITSYLASRSQEEFKKAMSVISNLNAELEKIPLDKEFNILDKNEGEFPNNILDSKILKTRGRPTIASSSRSSSQGKDKNKRKSDDRHCAICSGTDHDKRNCPTKPKLTTDSPTKPKLPSKKNDHAKKKMKDDTINQQPQMKTPIRKLGDPPKPTCKNSIDHSQAQSDDPRKIYSNTTLETETHPNPNPFAWSFPKLGVDKIEGRGKG